MQNKSQPLGLAFEQGEFPVPQLLVIGLWTEGVVGFPLGEQMIHNSGQFMGGGGNGGFGAFARPDAAVIGAQAGLGAAHTAGGQPKRLAGTVAHGEQAAAQNLAAHGIHGKYEVAPSEGNGEKVTARMRLMSSSRPSRGESCSVAAALREAHSRRQSVSG